MEDLELINSAKILWDFLVVDEKPQKADAILGLGSFYTRVAEHAANLYLQGFAPRMIFSGGAGRLSDKNWNEPEADIFARIATQMGVPPDKILIESKSTNTSENIIFTKSLLEEKEIGLKKIIVCQFPHGTRRSLATIRKRWPEIEVIMSAPPVTFEEYRHDDNLKKFLFDSLVGEISRLIKYPQLGFIAEQEVPQGVLSAFESLVKTGYTYYLV